MYSPFLGWPFQRLELNQRAQLTQYLARYPQFLSGYTFASLASWDPIFEYSWMREASGTLLISCLLDPDRNRHLMQPLGPLPGEVQEQLIREAASLSYPLRIVGVGEDFLKDSADFVRHCKVKQDPAASNYIYLAESLARLPGRKYSKKRNLLSQAQGSYTWVSASLTAASTEACIEVLQRIQEEEQPEIDTNLQQELSALERTLNLWEELGQEGLFLKVAGKPVAFSIYEPIHPTMVAVHFERALRSYKGLYQVINWETARVIAAKGFEFINREEDLGSPGLRDAKRSYSPVRLQTAYELTLAS